MTPGADVRSIPALREWLAALAKYRAEAAEALAGVEMEIRRGTAWLADQERLWKQAVRDSQEAVVQAKARLASKKFPNWDGKLPDTTIEERNLRRAEEREDYAREKVRACRAWEVKLPKMIDEYYTAAARRLALYLEGDLVRGMAVLDRQVASLESYAELKPDFAPGPMLTQPPPPEASGGRPPAAEGSASKDDSATAT